MNIVIFAAATGGAQALTASLAQSGHLAELVHSHGSGRKGVARSQCWNDEAAVRALAAQADLVVYQLSGNDADDAGAHAWLTRLPGILWLCGANPVHAARRFGAHALGILAPAGTDLDALLPFCAGSLLHVDSDQPAAAVLRAGQAVQGAMPVYAAADAMAAVLRRWGADVETVRGCGLAAGFDLFGA